jgi:hypothetical protein
MQEMSFKFSVGQAVEYTPRGGQPGLFTVVRRMPEEFGESDLKYRIRNSEEGFERTVPEYDLIATDRRQEEYGSATPLRHTRKY